MYGIKKRHIAAILVLSIPILAAILPNPLKENIKLQIASGLSPFLSAANTAAFGIQRAFIPKGLFLGRLNNQSELIESLKAQNANIVEYSLENQRLKGLVSFKDTLAFRAIPSKIIARDASGWRSSVIINKGAVSGVKKNMFVMSQEGLVGRVCESAKTMSRVILLTDIDFKVACVIQRSREQAIAEGSGRGLCSLKYLPSDADIKEGDIAVTSGLGGFCPKGILIGVVVSVHKQAGNLATEAFLKPTARINRLEEALVIAPE